MDREFELGAGGWVRYSGRANSNSPKRLTISYPRIGIEDLYQQIKLSQIGCNDLVITIVVNDGEQCKMNA